MRVEVLLLSDDEVKGILTMAEAIQAVEAAFREKGLGRVQMPPKPYIFYRKYSGDLRVMPSYLEESDISGVKVVNSHPDNLNRFNLPTVIAIILLIDPKTGVPIAIMGGTWITAMRTGAGSAVATKYLARKHSKTLSLVGTGAQAMTQLMALAEEVGELEEVRAWSPVPESRRRFLQEVRQRYPYRFIECSDAKTCVEGADILCTATPSRAPLVSKEWVKPGCHINAIGADAPGKQELDPKLVKASKIVVDDWAQASHSGEINVPLEKGLLNESDVYGELGEIVVGKKPGRTFETEITLYDSTGLSIMDIATATLVLRKAEKQGIGRKVRL